MELNVAREQARLEELPIADLKREFETLWEEPCRSSNRTWLIRRILWRMQARAEGDLSERARKRAFAIADDADLRIRPPANMELAPVAETQVFVQNSDSRDPRLPIAGTELTRTYKGQTVSVLVLQQGFEYRGERYGSLSAVAKAITGSHMNGFAFFGLKGKQ
jgi:hypothetical protein